MRTVGRLMWWWLGLAPVVVAMCAPRSDWDGPSVLQALGLAVGDPTAMGSMANLALNLGLLALALPLALAGAMRQSWRSLAAGPGALAIAALAMAASLVINPLTSTPSGAVLWPAVALAVLLGGPDITAGITGRLRAICVLLVWGSLIAGVLVPAWAVQPDYDLGIIPGLSVRLYGLTGHSNQLAVAAFLGFVLLLHDPEVRRRRMHLLGCLAVILLAQSKTIFLLVPVALAVRWGFLALPAIRPPKLGFAAAGLLGLMVIAAILVNAHDETGVQEAALGEDTYHARTVIWDITLREWRERPLFGYGPTLWDAEMGRRHQDEMGWLVRGHAHNQYVQTLGQSGVVGLLAFLAFLAWLLARGAAKAWTGDGREASLLALILVRSVVEPFMYSQILDMGALFMLGTVAMLVEPPDTDCPDARTGPAPRIPADG